MSNAANSLSLLRENYGSDSESDENEADTTVQSINEKIHSRKETTLLPFPEALKNLYAENVIPEPNDCSEFHDGRIRSFPHERGNWATCIFIPYHNSKYLQPICNEFLKLCQTVSDLHVCSDFHVSLSRTVVIRYHWIEPLVDDIRKRVKSIKKFFLDFDDVGIYTNDEKTRTFIGLKTRLGYNDLLDCVKYVDNSFAEFKLPAYYEDPSFHMSLIWCLGDKKLELEPLLPVLKNHFATYRLKCADLPPETVTRLCCKTGNRMYNFELK